MGRPKAPCGTDAAYRRHLREGVEVDAACRRAHTDAGRKSSGRANPRSTQKPAAAESSARDDESDDMKLIVDTLRTAFKAVADDNPARLAPIAREFRIAVETVRGPVEPPKELTLAEQLTEARVARAARAQSKDAAS